MKKNLDSIYITIETIFICGKKVFEYGELYICNLSFQVLVAPNSSHLRNVIGTVIASTATSVT